MIFQHNYLIIRKLFVYLHQETRPERPRIFESLSNEKSSFPVFILADRGEAGTRTPAAGILAGRVYGPNCIESAPYAAKIMKNINLSELSAKIENLKTRSAWQKGIKEYAAELVEKLEEYAGYSVTPGNVEVNDPAGFLEICLNGAQDWEQYSRGGMSLVYDGTIAERLCTKSELKRVNGGERMPNRFNDWIDIQARALRQAYSLVVNFAFPAA